MKKRTPLLVLLALVLAGTAATAEAVRVLNARGVELETGLELDGCQPLELPQGSAVTLATCRGIIHLKGPRRQPPLACDEGQTPTRSCDLVDVVGQLLGSESASGSGTRSFGISVGPPELWWIDSRVPGNHCLPADQPAVLWRARATSDVEYRISGSGRRKDFWWDAGQTTIEWPAELEIGDGSVYSVGPRGTTTRRITLRHLSEAPAREEEQVAWLVDHGCRHQARNLLSRMVARLEEQLAEEEGGGAAEPQGRQR